MTDSLSINDCFVATGCVVDTHVSPRWTYMHSDELNYEISTQDCFLIDHFKGVFV